MGNFTLTPSTRATAKRMFRGSRELFVTDTGAVHNFDVMVRPDDAEAGTKTSGPFPARELLAADEIEPMDGGVRVRTGVRWALLRGNWSSHAPRGEHDSAMEMFGTFEPIGTLTEAGVQRGALGSLAACMATDAANVPVLSGACFEADGTAWATDRYRLARLRTGMDIQGAPDVRVIVSARIITEVAKAKAWELSVGDNLSRAHLNGLVITAWNVEGDFPRVAGLIPENGGDTAVSAPVGELLKALKLLAPPKNTPVTLHSDGTMSFEDAETHPGEGDGDVQSRIALNPKYLADLVKSHGAKAMVTIRWRSEAPQKPALVTVDGEDDLRMVIMPVRHP